MPGPIVHLIVQQRLAAALRRHDAVAYAERLEKGDCDPYAAFGSMGPDFLFFSLSEYGTPLDELVNFIFGVYDAFEPLIEFYDRTIGPIEDAIDDAIAAADVALFQGLFAQIKQTAELASQTALVAAGAAVTSGIDLFYPFYPKIQAGAPESDWYWFDFLHYRRTGQFASNMWANASGDAELERYVLGYVSHIASDVVGHPFVNTITGGPYRMHWHRHKLVENWIDAYARNRREYRDSRRTRECLNIESPDDIYLADAISGSYYYRLVEFPGGKMPQKLEDLLLKTMDQTFAPMGAHPPFMNSGDLDSTYRLWLKWFERSTSIGSGRPPAFVPPPGGATTTLINDYVSGFPSFPGGGGAPSSSGGLASILAALFAFAKWVADVVSHTVDWIINHAIDIITLPFTEAIALIKWLLYQVQKGIFDLYDNLRFMLVLGAYLFPEPRDLPKMPWGKALLNTSYVHLTGGIAPDFYNYPRKQESHGLLGTTEHHLAYPGILRERDHAEPMPYPFHDRFPEVFISENHTYAATIERLFDAQVPYGPPAPGQPDPTHDVDTSTWDTAQLGSAIDFSARLIRDRLKDLPNFNLDGDRGYGWKTWRAQDPKNINTNNPVPVDYIDA